MGNWKNLLPPLLTVLAVLALALLPRQLSLLEDRKLGGVVQSEAMAADSNFPAKPPDLPGRVWLLVQWQQSPENCTIIQQELTEPDAQAEAAVQARTAMTELSEAGILPAGHPDFPEGFTASRLYLRDQTDLSSAGFLLVENRDQREYALSMILDLETGLALSFRLGGPNVIMEDLSPQIMGQRFLDRLGLEYEALGGSGLSLYSFGFRLPESRSIFLSTVSRYLLKFSPELDLDATGPHGAAEGSMNAAGSSK